MPWRLIAVIVIFAVFLAFVTFNLDNKCDVNFGVAKVSDVPVFLTIFISFILGLFFALPIGLTIRKKRKEKHETKEDNSPIDAGEARKKFLSRWKKSSDGGSNG
jgi:uncharacterized integral membrane protein